MSNSSLAGHCRASWLITFSESSDMSCKSWPSAFSTHRGSSAARGTRWPQSTGSKFMSLMSSMASALLTASSSCGSPGTGREKLGRRSSEPRPKESKAGSGGRCSGEPSTGLSTSTTRGGAGPSSMSWK